MGFLVEVRRTAGLVELDAPIEGWGDAHALSAILAAPVGVDLPSVLTVECPVGGQSEVRSDGFAEVIGNPAIEPSVEQVTAAYRIRCGPLHTPIRTGDVLGTGSGATSVRVERDCICWAWCSGSGERLFHRVGETLGEGLVVLLAADGDRGLPCWPRGCVCLPGIAAAGQGHGLVVESGRVQGRLFGDDDFDRPVLLLGAPRKQLSLQIQGDSLAADCECLYVGLLPAIHLRRCAVRFPSPN